MREASGALDFRPKKSQAGECEVLETREMVPMTKELAEQLGARKNASTLLVLFIPSVDRYGVAIDQDAWVERALSFLGSAFGGATAFP